MTEQIELYLHIPFCAAKCAYCDFLSAPAEEETIGRYVRALETELKVRSEQYHKPGVSTIFFGGGTPSFIPADYIADLMECIRYYYSVDAEAEITLEANPGTVTKESLRIYKESGINRISVGLQSSRNPELKMLGRIHSYEDFLKSYDLIRKAGFQNVNVDLMSGLPGQTVESYKKTLQNVVLLRPEHISAYSLQIEEGTPFYERFAADLEARERGEEPLLLPSEEADRAMYMLTKEVLEQYGYHRYEISNYARKNKECRHNNGYWTGVPYLGLGLGASSYLEGERFKNESDLGTYLKNALVSAVFPRMEVEKISRKEQMEEFMFLGLRRTEGVTRSDFMQRFGSPIEAMYGDVIQKMCAAQLMVQEAGRIYLTEEGIDLSNRVLAEFLLES